MSAHSASRPPSCCRARPRPRTAARKARAMADPFEVLLKVARTRRDAAAQAMNLAQQRIAQVRAEIARLEAIERGTRSTDETMFATGTFLLQVGRRKRQLLGEIPGLGARPAVAKPETLEA